MRTNLVCSYEVGKTIRSSEIWKVRINPRWLDPDFVGQITVDHVSGITELMNDEVAFHFNDKELLESDFPISNPETVKMTRYEVNGYGLGLMRTVWQAPTVGDSKIHMGLTVNHAGSWSSFPPHPFERVSVPLGFHEIFFIMAKPVIANLMGLQAGAVIFRAPLSQQGFPPVQHPTISFVPDRAQTFIFPGVHAVTAAPGCQVGYLWAFTSTQEIEKRIEPETGKYADEEN